MVQLYLSPHQTEGDKGFGSKSDIKFCPCSKSYESSDFPDMVWRCMDLYVVIYIGVGLADFYDTSK